MSKLDVSCCDVSSDSTKVLQINVGVCFIIYFQSWESIVSIFVSHRTNEISGIIQSCNTNLLHTSISACEAAGLMHISSDSTNELQFDENIMFYDISSK